MIQHPVSTNIPPGSIEFKMMQDIHTNLAIRLAKVQEQVIADAVKTFETELRGLVGSVAINLAEYYSIQRLGPDLVITVKMEHKQ